MAIPKIIHWCWFSGEKPNRFISNCVKSWKKVMPDYDIKLWDANSFDFNSIPFVKGAFEAKKWAFVADYIRLYALFTEGGIYLDSDVKVFKRFDEFLNNKFFIGTEPLANNNVELESAIMGSVPNHPYINTCLNYYNKIRKIQWNSDNWIREVKSCPVIMSKILEQYGYSYEDKTLNYEDGIKVYSQKYFGHCFGTDPKDLYAIHYFNASWLKKRGFFYEFCKSNDMMTLYITIEKYIKKLKL